MQMQVYKAKVGIVYIIVLNGLYYLNLPVQFRNGQVRDKM